MRPGAPWATSPEDEHWRLMVFLQGVDLDIQMGPLVMTFIVVLYCLLFHSKVLRNDNKETQSPPPPLSVRNDMLWIIISAKVMILFPLMLSNVAPTKLLCPWGSPGKNTRVGCHFLLQGSFPSQELNPCLVHLLHWKADSLPLSHQGSPVLSQGGLLSIELD